MRNTITNRTTPSAASACGRSTTVGGSPTAHTTSKAKVVYGTVYEIPEEIGRVEVATFGSVLRHVRDPFLALRRHCG